MHCRDPEWVIDQQNLNTAQKALLTVAQAGNMSEKGCATIPFRSGPNIPCTLVKNSGVPTFIDFDIRLPAEQAREAALYIEGCPRALIAIEYVES